MRMYDIIKKKRCGFRLSQEEISFFVREYTNGRIPDEQASALLMAICFQGMDTEETVILTQEIANSGDITDLSSIDGFKVDKHSSGGVGDKTSLIVIPIVSAVGVKVAKMSGRGLGHTGGTIDKLESIPGFKTSLSRPEFFKIVQTAGLCIAGQSGDLAPADKKLYALRDVTATVDCLPLIASSIMGKKLASGADGIVLDVKVGNGSFNKKVEDGFALAETMVDIGVHSNKKMIAVISDMSRPLGQEIGNALEIKEAIRTLKGINPDPDLQTLCIELAACMIYLSGKGNLQFCRTLSKKALKSGDAYRSFTRMVEAQGGDIKVLENPELLPHGQTFDVISDREGYITNMDTEQYGAAALALGAGRNQKDDSIDFSAGITVLKKSGDYVKQGDILAHLHTSDTSRFPIAEKILKNALSFGEAKPLVPPIIHRILGAEE